MRGNTVESSVDNSIPFVFGGNGVLSFKFEKDILTHAYFIILYFMKSLWLYNEVEPFLPLAFMLSYKIA